MKVGPVSRVDNSKLYDRSMICNICSITMSKKFKNCPGCGSPNVSKSKETEQPAPTPPIQKGEEIKVVEEYKVFGYNAKGQVGVYISKSSTTGKSLVYFPKQEEWGELEEDKYKRLKPGKISKKNKEFISRVKKMEWTC